MDSARDFAANLLRLLRLEQFAMADFLVALADFDERRHWLKLGHSSLFTFLHRELGLSKGASHFRKVAAELIQRFPEVVEPLRDGRLCITSIVELARVITPQNRAEVLPRFFHASKQEAKMVAAEICPQAAVPRREVVTAVAMQAAHSLPLAPSLSHVRQTSAEVRPVELALAPPPPAQAPRTTAEPLTADLRRLHVTVSKRFMGKLEAARDVLSHSHPGGNAEEILEAGLDLLIDRAAKRKGISARPRTEKGAASPNRSSAEARKSGDPIESESAESRHIPAHVRREAWTRDGGCCQWPLDGGGICGCRHRLQFDHVIPHARGGKSTVANVRVLCATHNLLSARQLFGDDWMDQFTRQGFRLRSPEDFATGQGRG